MAGKVGASNSKHRPKNTNKCSSSIAAPATRVLELSPHVLGVSAWAHNPQYNDEGEKAEDVKDKPDTFYQRKLFYQESVPKDREHCNADGEQGAVPPLDLVRWHVQSD
jgi:hypothetical protein